MLLRRVTSGGATNFRWGGGYSPGCQGTEVPQWDLGANTR